MESKLQSRIIADLKKKGWLVNKVLRCSNAGWPDIECLRAMEIFWIEVKDKGKKVRPLQEYIHKLLKRHGFTVYVVDTWEEYEKLGI